MMNSCRISSSMILIPRFGDFTRYSFGVGFHAVSLCPLNQGPQVGSCGNQSRFSWVASVTHSAMLVIVFIYWISRTETSGSSTT